MSIAPMSFAIALTASVERTSSARQSVLRPASFDLSRSVAMTLAPSAAKSSAVSRPIPAPAAVKNAVFPVSRPATSLSLDCFLHMNDPAIAQCFGPFDRISAPLIPSDIVDEQFARVQTQGTLAQLTGAGLRGGDKPVTKPAATRIRSGRDAPDEEVIGARFQDENARQSAFGLLVEQNLVLAQNFDVVGLERNWLDIQNCAVAFVRGTLKRSNLFRFVRPRAAQVFHRGAVPFKAVSDCFCVPFASKLSGANHRSNAALRAGQSVSSIANHAVSRLWP